MWIATSVTNSMGREQKRVTRLRLICGDLPIGQIIINSNIWQCAKTEDYVVLFYWLLHATRWLNTGLKMIYYLLSLSRWFCLAWWRQMSSLSGTLFTQIWKTIWPIEALKQDSQFPLFQGNIIADWLNETFRVWRTFWEEVSVTDSLSLGKRTTLCLYWSPNGFGSSWMVTWKDKYSSSQVFVV